MTREQNARFAFSSFSRLRRMRAISRARGLSRERARERKLLALAPGKLTSWRPADMRPAPELMPEHARPADAHARGARAGAPATARELHPCPALAPGAQLPRRESVRECAEPIGSRCRPVARALCRAGGRAGGHAIRRGWVWVPSAVCTPAPRPNFVTQPACAQRTHNVCTNSRSRVPCRPPCHRLRKYFRPYQSC